MHETPGCGALVVKEDAHEEEEVDNLQGFGKREKSLVAQASAGIGAVGYGDQEEVV